jgi:CheY-like chemotaxis protein/signal recognition particle receptor subunit beta
MALLDHSTKEITAKLVYYGPALCGKTTNLQWINEHVAFMGKGKLLELPTGADRTLFFEFLPVEFGTTRGMKTRVQIYTVPGQVFYDSTRRMVLKGADAVVFVADSQAALLDANLESLENLRENLIANGLDPALPTVLQYNKRDLETALPVALLNARLNPGGLPFHEAVAIEGIGVEDTLKTAAKLLFKALSDTYGREPTTRTAAPPPTAPGPSAPPPPAPRAADRRRAKAEEPRRLSRDLRAPIEEPPRRRSTDRSPTLRGLAEPEPPRAVLGADQWVYLVGGEQRGPVEFDDLVDLVLTSIPEDTKVWRGGIPRWTPANLVPEIAEQIPPPLPAAGPEREEEYPDFNTVPEMLRTALIADEDATFRQRLALPLAAQRFRIYEAKDGAEAWRLATERRPWLMLADLGMPEVDGFEFCRRVRANSLLSHRPLVFVSGSDRYRERYRAMQLGADDFLSKQTPIRELLIRIQLLLTRYSDLGGATGKQVGAGSGAVAGALEGQIEAFGAPGVLQICNQGRLTGIFTARGSEDSGAGERIAVFGLRDGEIITATVQDLTGPEAVYAFLAWDRGHFKFVPGDPGSGAPLAQTLEHLLLEGCRRLDESRGGAEEPGADGGPR